MDLRSDSKRVFVRIDDKLNCTYQYRRAGGKAKEEKATIKNISAGGVKLIVNELLCKGTMIELAIAPPLGPLTVKGEVVQSQLEKFIADKGQIPHWTANIKFIKVPLPDRNKLIMYVHSCRVALRKARSRKKDKT